MATRLCFRQRHLTRCAEHLRRRLLADPEEDQVYVFDVTEFGECVQCGVADECAIGQCVPDNRRRGLRFGMSTSGCCRGA